MSEETSACARPPNSLAEIDAEIATLEERLDYLRSHRNTLIPIAHLPSEILAKIFTGAITLHILPTQTDRSQLLWISWVSRRWRTVALGCANLWTHIHGRNVNWLDESIRRSGQATLTMDLSITDPTEKGRAPYLRYIPRLEELTVQMPAAYGKVIAHLWKSPAPLLQYLEVKHAVIPDDLFSGDAPSLRIVLLRDCFFKISSLPFSSVRQLTLGNYWPDTPLFSLLYKLQEMPLLVKLHLTRIEGGAEDDSLPSVNFLNLEYLHLYQPDTLTATAFINHLSYPAKTNIRVEFDDIPEPVEFLEVLEVSEKGYNSKNNLHTLEAVSSSSNYISFTYNSESPGSNSSSGGRSGNISLDRPTGSLNDLFQLVSGHRLQTLSILIVAQDYVVSVETWRDIFSQLPHLRELQLQHHPADTFLSYLVQYHPRSKSDTQSFDSTGNFLIPFPALDTLEFDWTSSPPDIFPDVDYQIIRAVLALRQQLGKHMRHWYVPRGVWSAEITEMLRPVVEDLEVEDDDSIEDMGSDENGG
ncbi:hypothetical protein BDN72DRAFT_847283 [Pluteus cervinus]|uniref:Uncharacterized protein n=1 Tax=Pluteus cervinus TaxID=181527 RepID=A0ACD3AD10_9AGAR|nr:hypothetical protein BDN72DRAFT_847283 [Pluteus cervinus]